jgi:uncharacterized protein YdaU (DUF1376 family)
MKTYIGDEAALTGHLTAEEFGAYERLRRHCWQHGSLPDGDARLMRIGGVEPERWSDVASAIIPLLAEALPKLDQERSEAAEKREKKIAAGQKGARKRWGENSSINSSAIGTTTSTPNGNGAAMAEPIATSTSTRSKGAYEEGLAPTRTHTHAREAEPSEYPFDPPETVEQGRRFLEARGVKPEEMEAKLTKLMNWRLYPSEVAT